MSEHCERCGSVGEDRRTLHMACFYNMSKLGLPFKDEVLLDADPADCEKAKEPWTVTLPGMPSGSITLQPGTVRCKGELIPQHLYTLRVCKRCRGEWLAAIAAWFAATPSGVDHDADDYQSGGECGSGIFVRENGALREITRAEWDRRNLGREPVVLSSEKQ